MNGVKKGVVIGFVTNLGHGSGGFSVGRNLNRNSGLPTMNTRVIGTPHMVFTNPILIIHVNKTTNRPLMNLIVVGGYKSTMLKIQKEGVENHLS
jgi:hypothetical protein